MTTKRKGRKPSLKELALEILDKYETDATIVIWEYSGIPSQATIELRAEIAEYRQKIEAAP